jgi:hypothetical protein
MEIWNPGLRAVTMNIENAMKNRLSSPFSRRGAGRVDGGERLLLRRGMDIQRCIFLLAYLPVSAFIQQTKTLSQTRPLLGFILGNIPVLILVHLREGGGRLTFCRLLLHSHPSKACQHHHCDDREGFAFHQNLLSFVVMEGKIGQGLVLYCELHPYFAPAHSLSGIVAGMLKLCPCPLIAILPLTLGLRSIALHSCWR